MKQFIIRILWFIVPLLIGVVILFSIPVSKKYGYGFIVKGGCAGRSNWLYQRIFEDTTPIDVAFIGTSHTMNAVQDSTIQQQYNLNRASHLHFTNLAYCGFGRNFDYIVIKDLLEHKKVKTLVLEIRENEAQLGHALFPAVAGAGDVLNAPLAYNRSYLPDVYQHFNMRLQYVRELITREDAARAIFVDNNYYGYNPANFIADTNELNAHSQYLARRKTAVQFIEDGLNSCPLTYIQRIAALAKAHHIQLLFNYLPSYGAALNTGRINTWYGTYGVVLYPDSSILLNKQHWADAEHLNTSGSVLVSQGLVTQLSGYIK